MISRRNYFHTDNKHWIRVEKDVIELLTARYGDKWFPIVTNELRVIGHGLKSPSEAMAKPSKQLTPD